MLAEKIYKIQKELEEKRLLKKQTHREIGQPPHSEAGNSGAGVPPSTGPIVSQYQLTRPPVHLGGEGRISPQVANILFGQSKFFILFLSA